MRARSVPAVTKATGLDLVFYTLTLMKKKKRNQETQRRDWWGLFSFLYLRFYREKYSHEGAIFFSLLCSAPIILWVLRFT